jgi:tetraacyldisaccharide 4'-kinase
VRRGRRPCLVTRGYGGSAEGASPWILDEAEAALPGAAEGAGDEAVLLALRSGVPVVIGADRARACAAAAAVLARTPDVYVLDDGFQHRRLARDLDIVLVSGREAGERLLPAGPLREPVSALARAGVVVTMRDEAGSPGESLGADVARSAARVEATASASGLVSNVADAETTPLAGLAGRRVVAVAGIARPERFLATLRRAGADVVATLLRRDHHRYVDGDRREIEVASAGADLVVTTEKDLAKLAGSVFRAPLAAVRIEVAFASVADEEQLAARAAGLQTI